MKKWLGIALCVAGVVTITHWPGTATANTQSDGQKGQMDAKYLEEAFAATGATASGFVINSWAQLDDNFDEMSQISKIVGKTAQDLSITHAKVIKRTEDGERYYEIQGDRPSGASAAVIVTSLDAPDDGTQTVMVVREDATKYQKDTLSNDLEQLNKTARIWTNNPVISACIEGSTDDRMGDAVTRQLIQHVFARVDAKRVEGITTGDVTSISGYSPLGPDFIQTNGRKMNLQVGLHYNDVDHRMNVVVGTPIITITY
jgi:hypothetical protein